MTYLTARTVDHAAERPIVVTGSSGYLGTELCKQFRLADIDFIGVDKEPGGGSKTDVLNLAVEGPVRELFREVSPGTVIHGGTHSAEAYRDDFVRAFNEDVMAVSNVLGALSASSARLIFFSSSYVYSGLDSTEPVDERTALSPSHNFGVAKLFFEQFVLRNHPNSVVFRLSSVFGHGAQRHPNVIANMAADCQVDGRLTIWGEGKRRMQYIHIQEVVLGVLESLTIAPGLYNLGGSEYTSVASAADQIAGFFDSAVEYLTEKPEGDTLPFMLTEKLRSAIPEYRSYPFAAALEAYLARAPL